MKKQRGAFGPDHELWEDALTLRKPPHFLTYEQIAIRLRDAGENLSARQVRDAMVNYAPLVLRLPERAGDYLRRTHTEFLEAFDSWETLKLLIVDTLAELGTVNQKLEDETLDASEQARLVDLRHAEVERAWRFTSELERLRRELDPTYVPSSARGVPPGSLPPGSDPARLVGAGAAAFLAGMNELEKRVLDTLQGSDSKLSGLLGGGNVSPVGQGAGDDDDEDAIVQK